MSIVKRVYFEVDNETFIKIENKYYHRDHLIAYEQAIFQESHDLFSFFYDFHNILTNEHPLLTYTSHANLLPYILKWQDYKIITTTYHKTALISRFEREDKKFEKF